MFLVGFIVGWIAWACVKTRLIVTVTSLLITSVVISESRGMWIWAGTFDRALQSRWDWLVPLFVGGGTSLLLGSGLRGQAARWVPRVEVTMFILVAASILTYVQSSETEMITVFPPTRHFVLFGLVALSAVGLLFIRLRNEN
ncbi:MAG: hypothetical protein ACOYON_07780 [Fimbriimonas sp.]